MRGSLISYNFVSDYIVTHDFYIFLETNKIKYHPQVKLNTYQSLNYFEKIMATSEKCYCLELPSLGKH